MRSLDHGWEIACWGVDCDVQERGMLGMLVFSSGEVEERFLSILHTSFVNVLSKNLT